MLTTENSPQGKSGKVVTNYGKKCLIIDATNKQVMCTFRHSITTLVAGDEVIWENRTTIPNVDLLNETKKKAYFNNEISFTKLEPTGYITKLCQPKNQITRQAFRNKIKRIAANIDLLFVVAGAKPGFHTDIIDRYLALGQHIGVECVVIFNKCDLLTEQSKKELTKLANIYADINYKVLKTSTKYNTTTSILTNLINNKTAVFVGESGVGKSSLISCLIPNLDIKIQALSDYSGLGQHTTTHSTLYTVNNDSYIVDSPGIREFVADELEQQNLDSYYIEFNELRQKCKFSNCKHINEPQCAIIDAVADGKVASSRYKSYCRWFNSLDSV